MTEVIRQFVEHVELGSGRLVRHEDAVIQLLLSVGNQSHLCCCWCSKGTKNFAQIVIVEMFCIVCKVGKSSEKVM